MAVTFGTLIERMLYETNKSANDFETGIKNAIVSALIYMESNHPWLLSKAGDVIISEGTRATDLPDDLNTLITAQYNIGTVINGDRQGFLQLSFNELINLFNNTSESGYPTRYAVFGDQLYVYPYTNTDTTVTLYYNYTDTTYPAVDSDTSVWFDDKLVDGVRYKALEIFYRDTLQTPELGNVYTAITRNFEDTLKKRNNYRDRNNLLNT